MGAWLEATMGPAVIPHSSSHSVSQRWWKNFSGFMLTGKLPAAKQCSPYNSATPANKCFIKVAVSQLSCNILLFLGVMMMLTEALSSDFSSWKQKQCQAREPAARHPIQHQRGAPLPGGPWGGAQWEWSHRSESDTPLHHFKDTHSLRVLNTNITKWQELRSTSLQT